MTRSTFFWCFFLVISAAALWGEGVVLDGGSLIPRFGSDARIDYPNVVENDKPEDIDAPPARKSTGGSSEETMHGHAPTIDDRPEGADANGEVAKRLGVRVASLQAALASAQAAADHARREKAAAVARLALAQGGDADRKREFEKTQKRVAAVTTALAAAKLQAAQATAAKERIESERAQASASQAAALAVAEGQVDRAGRERVAAMAALRAFESGAAKRRAKLDDAQTRAAAALASAHAEADQAGRNNVAAIAELHASQSNDADDKARLAEAHKRVAALVAELAHAKTEIARAAIRRLADERAKGSAQQAALAAAQAEADQARRYRNAAVAALNISEGTDADDRAKLAEAQKRVDAVTAQLTSARLEAARAKSERLAGERADGGAQQAALASAQAKADQADRDKAAAVAALHASETAAADERAKFEGAKEQVAALAAELAHTKTEVAQATSQRLAGERAEGSAQLAATQAEAEQARRDKTAAVTALQASESADANDKAKLADAQKRVDALSAQVTSERADDKVQQAALASAQAEADQAARGKAAVVAALDKAKHADADREGKLEAAQTRVAALAAELVVARRETAQATAVTKNSEPPTDGRDVAVSRAERPSTDQGVRLPDGGMVHVILRYRMSSDSGRTRAMAVRSSLDDLGLDITDRSEALDNRAPTRVFYYYKQDENAAAGIAERIRASEPVRTRISTDRLPRPGTVEISLGGQPAEK